MAFSLRQRAIGFSVILVLSTVALVATLAGGAGSAAGATVKYGAVKKCVKPAKTTVTVQEFEFGFTLKPARVHCGTVTFVQKNVGSVPHNFVLKVRGGSSPLVAPGASFTKKLIIAPGSYQYLCTVIGHAAQGMVGTLKVSG
jgi:plastocyanin